MWTATDFQRWEFHLPTAILISLSFFNIARECNVYLFGRSGCAPDDNR